MQQLMVDFVLFFIPYFFFSRIPAVKTRVKASAYCEEEKTVNGLHKKNLCTEPVLCNRVIILGCIERSDHPSRHVRPFVLWFCCSKKDVTSPGMKMKEQKNWLRRVFRAMCRHENIQYLRKDNTYAESADRLTVGLDIHSALVSSEFQVKNPKNGSTRLPNVFAFKCSPTCRYIDLRLYLMGFCHFNLGGLTSNFEEMGAL